MREREPYDFFSADGSRTGGIVEQRALEWGEKKLRRTLSRERTPKKGSAILIVDRETLNSPLELPKLAPQDQRVASLRYHPITGEIYVPIWRELELAIDGVRRFLPAAGDFQQLRRKSEKTVDLANLPEGRIVRKLRMECSPDIHTAIRQTVHIRESFLVGPEAEQLKIIWREINQAWDTVLKGKVNENNLDQLAEETALVLRKSGLAQAEKLAKKRIYSRLSDVFKKDKLERLNSLLQRIRLRSAYLNVIGLEAFSVLVSEKFAAIEGVLLMEREITRQSIAGGEEALNTIIGFNKRGAHVFEGGRPREGELEGLETAFYGIVLLLNRPRVAPYLPITRSACIALWGCRPEKVEENRKVIGEEPSGVLLDPSFICIRDLIRQKKFADAKNLARFWVFDPLATLLKETAKTG